VTDDELQTLLRRYRPVDPSASLHAAVLDASRSRSQPLDWLDVALVSAAAAVLLAVVITRAPGGLPTPQEAERARVVNEMASSLGGGATAVRIAEMAVPPVEVPARLTTREQP
jgi:hypothetical protein